MAEAAHANRADEMERIKNLHAAGHSPEIEYDRTVTALRSAVAELAAANASLARTHEQKAVAEAAVAVAEAALNEAQAHLERCVVRSPASGRVNRFYIEPGEYVLASAPLVEVIRLDRMKMIVELADTVIPFLQSFQGADVIADADVGRMHSADLDHVAPKMDPASRKFRVELRVDNEDDSLLSGMYGRAVMRCGQLRDVICVPRQAVFKHFGADSCLVMDGDEDDPRAKLRRVEVREIQGRLDDLQVLSGLQIGDRLIVSQRRDLRDGSRVDMTELLAADGETAP
jgi:RND family efflux transporter MFP subunit